MHATRRAALLRIAMGAGAQAETPPTADGGAPRTGDDAEQAGTPPTADGGAPRTGDDAGATPATRDTTEWDCEKCTLTNVSYVGRCAACEEPRVGAPAASDQPRMECLLSPGGKGVRNEEPGSPIPTFWIVAGGKGRGKQRAPPPVPPLPQYLLPPLYKQQGLSNDFEQMLLIAIIVPPGPCCLYDAFRLHNPLF